MKAFKKFIKETKHISKLKHKDIDENVKNFTSRGWLDTTDDAKLLERANTPIGIFGTGMSSNLVEHLIKSGFFTQYIFDGDRVENHNRLRQDFNQADIGEKKVDALLKNIKQNYSPFHRVFGAPVYLNRKLIKKLFKNLRFKYIVNAIDFESDVFLKSHSISRGKCKFELFPFSLGDYGVVIVFDKDSPSFQKFFKTDKSEQIQSELIKHCCKKILEKRLDIDEKQRIYSLIDKYEKERELRECAPQQDTAVMKCCIKMIEIMRDDIRTERSPGKSKVRTFPEIYIV